MIDNIEIFPWNENFATGDDLVDLQHRHLVELLNKLASEYVNQSDILTLDQIFTELSEYVVYHFQTEDALMDQYLTDDEIAVVHKRAHNNFITDVLRLKSETDTKSVDTVMSNLLTFLTHWLAAHILESDFKMVNIVKAMQSGLTLKQAKAKSLKGVSKATRILIKATLGLYNDIAKRTLQLRREIAERQLAETKLRLASDAFDNTLEAIFITDADHILLDVNASFLHVSNLSRDQAIGTNLLTATCGFDGGLFTSEVLPKVVQSGHWTGKIWWRSNSGEISQEWLSLSAIKGDQGQTTNYVGVFSNVAQLIQRQNQLEIVAHHDSLTKLPNRLLLADRLNQAIAQASRNDEFLAVCYLDLDGFKVVNDTLGHAAGDLLLQEIATRLKALIRVNDTVARLGGDEFVLLLSGLKHREDCSGFLSRALREVERPIEISEDRAQVSVSIGVAVFPSDAVEPDELLELADQAMYQAKRAGKSRFHFSDSGQGPWSKDRTLPPTNKSR